MRPRRLTAEATASDDGRTRLRRGDTLRQGDGRDVGVAELERKADAGSW
ncbi:MAG: hypothetical protein O3A25_01505 [Acidobacteria bacterium]|nr:hypothetical protein [Acidobacteriota bacterium]